MRDSRTKVSGVVQLLFLWIKRTEMLRLNVLLRPCSKMCPIRSQVDCAQGTCSHVTLRSDLTCSSCKKTDMPFFVRSCKHVYFGCKFWHFDGDQWKLTEFWSRHPFVILCTSSVAPHTEVEPCFKPLDMNGVVKMCLKAFGSYLCGILTKAFHNIISTSACEKGDNIFPLIISFKMYFQSYNLALVLQESAGLIIRLSEEKRFRRQRMRLIIGLLLATDQEGGTG